MSKRTTQLLTIAQTADIMAVSVRTVRAYVSDGVLPVVSIRRPDARKAVTRIRLADVEALIASNVEHRGVPEVRGLLRRIV